MPGCKGGTGLVHTSFGGPKFIETKTQEFRKGKSKWPVKPYLDGLLMETRVSWIIAILLKPLTMIMKSCNL